MTKQELIKQIRRNNERINKRYDSAYVGGYISSEYLQTMAEKFDAITGNTSTRPNVNWNIEIKLTGIGSLKKQQLEDLLNQQQMFLQSKYTTRKGRAEIKRKQFETLQDKFPELTKKQFNILQKIFSDKNLIGEMVEKKGWDSNQKIAIAKAMKKRGFNDLEKAIKTLSEMPNLEKMTSTQALDELLKILKK